MAKKKKDLKRNEHRRKERKGKKERQSVIREAMRELANLLQRPEPQTARFERTEGRAV